LTQRIDRAYQAAKWLLGAGLLLVLVRGAGYEEAIILGITLLLLGPCAHYFYRRPAYETRRWSVQWLTAVVIVLVSATWLLVFAYKHLEYDPGLWLQFAWDAGAARSLRAMGSALLVFLAFFGVVWLWPREERWIGLPAHQIEVVRRLVAQSPYSLAHLALTGDKRVLLNETQTALVMYGTAGPAWIAIGDPVGEEDEVAQMAWDFAELSWSSGGWPAFYRADKERVPLYQALGLERLKIGEEARVRLDQFDLQRGKHRELRHMRQACVDQGWRVAVRPAGENGELMAQLRRVSAAWLAEVGIEERRFALGFFDPAYLAACPMALLERDNQVSGFCNLLTGGGRFEVGVDLLRFTKDAPAAATEYLLLESMAWAKSQGYQWFNLGMAPSPASEPHPIPAVLTELNRQSAYFTPHCHSIQGYRHLKDKFDPLWTAKYLIYPHHIPPAAVLAAVAGLVHQRDSAAP
jgi:phosphatidylglycerol lysyltransferase